MSWDVDDVNRAYDRGRLRGMLEGAGIALAGFVIGVFAALAWRWL